MSDNIRSTPHTCTHRVMSRWLLLFLAAGMIALAGCDGRPAATVARPDSTKNAAAVGLRELIREEEVDEVFEILKSREVSVEGQTWNRRYRGFMDKIKTGSVYDVAEVMRDLYRLKTDEPKRG